jgi:glycine dehydrogenase subunit 1
LSQLNLQKAHYAAERICAVPGFELAFTSPFFNEFVIKTQISTDKITTELLKDKILGGLDLGKFFPELQNHLLFCVTETKSKADIDRLAARLEGIK